MDLALKLFNNQKLLSKWNLTMSKATKPDEGKETKADREPKRGKVIPNWRFDNAEGNKMMTRNSTVFNWCTNDYHMELMWCAYNPCYNQANFKMKMKEKNGKEDKTDKGSEKKYQPLNDFRIVLFTMLLDEDYKTLEDQF
eukprot:9965338-Ditylum_brightwellii.AAC.1